MKPITELNPLVLTDTTDIYLQLQCDSMFDVEFGIIVLSSCIPVEFHVDEDVDSFYCYSVSSSNSDIKKIKVTFSPLLTVEQNSLHIIVIENSDAASTSLPIEKDFTYAIDVPVSSPNKSNVSFTDVVASGDKWLENIYDVFQYNSLTPAEQEFIDTNISSVKNNSLNMTLDINEAPTLNTKNTLIAPISDGGTGWLKCYGQAGKYATIIFVDNIPIRAFNNKYCLVWSAADYNQYLNVPFSFFDIDPGIHTIYALTVTLDNSDKQIVYDTYKLGLLLLDEHASNGSIVEDASVRICDSIGNDLPLQDNKIICESEVIYLEFTHSLNESYIPRDYNLYLLCNGIVQNFSIENVVTSSYTYTLEPQKNCTLKIQLKPQIISNPAKRSSDIRLDVLYLPELSDLHIADLDNSYTFHKRFILDYDTTSYLEFDCCEIFPTDSPQSTDAISVSVLTKDAPKIEYLFMGRYMMNNSTTMNYTASGLPQGTYIVFALLNGKPINLNNDSMYITYKIDSPTQKVDFSYTLKNEIDQRMKIVFITVSLDKTITRQSHIYYNQLMLEQVNSSSTSLGSVSAYRSYTEYYQNYVSFKGVLPVNSYCSSYNYIHRKADETMTVYGYSDYMNSIPLTSNEFIIEYFNSPSAWIVENTLHIYSSKENGFSVVKYRTPLATK